MKKILLLFYFVWISMGAALAVTKDYIATKESALKVGEVFLVSIYGDQVLSQRPFKVSSDKQSWILDGTFHCGKDEVCLGGVAHLEFNKSDGKITNVSHGK